MIFFTCLLPSGWTLLHFGSCTRTIFRSPSGQTSTTLLVVWGRDHRNCAHPIKVWRIYTHTNATWLHCTNSNLALRCSAIILWIYFHFDVFSIARWQEQYCFLHKNVEWYNYDIYLYSNKINTQLTLTRVQWKGPPPHIPNKDISVIGIQYTSSRHCNVCSGLLNMYDEVAFLDLSIAVPWRERLAQ